MVWPLKLTPNPNPTPTQTTTSSSTGTTTKSPSTTSTSPTPTKSAAQPGPEKVPWHPRIDENLKSGWDTGTRDLYALKRRLDLTYNLREESYTIEFLRAKLIGWGRKA